MTRLLQLKKGGNHIIAFLILAALFNMAWALFTRDAMQLIYFFPIFLAFMMIISNADEGYISNFGLSPRMGIGLTIIIGTILGGLIIVMLGIAKIQMPASPIIPGISQFFPPIIVFIIILLYNLFVTNLSEELMTKTILPMTIDKFINNLPVAYIVTTVIWLIMHVGAYGNNTMSYIGLIFIMLVTVPAVVLTGSVLVAIVAHFFYNLMAFGWQYGYVSSPLPVFLVFIGIGASVLIAEEYQK